MVFPIDINKRIQDKHKATAGDNKTQLIIVIWVLVNLVLVFVLSSLITFILGSSNILLLVALMLLINGFGGTLFFRFVIFDESEKVREVSEYANDSFARYMYVRKDVNHVMQFGEQEVTAVEFSDGNSAFVLELRFGSNNDAKAKRTQQVINQMIKLVGTMHLEIRLIVSPEDITKSEEYAHYLRTLNAIEDQTLRNCMLNSMEAITQASLERCNTNTLKVIVRSASAYQRADLETIAKNFCVLLSDRGTAFRSARFLNMDELLTFYCDFYGIDAIDVSMMRALEMSQETNLEYRKMLKVYSLQAASGKNFKSADKTLNTFATGEKSIG